MTEKVAGPDAAEGCVVRVAVYARVSTGKQAERGLSLDEQCRRARELARKRGWTVVAVYAERGVSGAKERRPQLDLLLEAADRRDFDALVTPHLDRLGRSARFLFNVHERLERNGIALVSVANNIDATNHYGRAQLGMLAVFAEFEREMIAERTREVAHARAAKGKPHGPVHFGYRRNTAATHPSWIPDEREADVYRRIVAELLAGRSQQGIARGLNHEGIPTKRGGPWMEGTIGKLLRSRTPLGEHKFDGTYRPADFDPIIDEATWQGAQAVLAASGRRRGHRGGRGRAPKSRHLFVGGMLRCAFCGGSMVPRSDRRSPAYFCFTRKTHGLDACPMRPAPRSIDAGVVAYYCAAALDVDATRLEVEHANHRQIAEARSRREQAERDAMAAEERLRRVRRDYQDGRLDADDWRDQRLALTAEAEAAERAITHAAAREQRITKQARSCDAEQIALRRLGAIEKAASGLTDDPATIDAFRATLMRLFEGFTLHRLSPEEVQAKAAEPTYWQPELLLPGALYIEPHPRPEVVESVGAGGWPTLRRARLEGGPHTYINATQM